MLSSSNPTTIEWLTSDIVYCGKQNELLKKFATKNFNKKSLYHHYKSMCKNNYLKYLKYLGIFLNSFVSVNSENVSKCI